MIRKEDSELFTASIIRIYNGDEIVGVGFCVSSIRILTCAHVVETALGFKNPPLDSEIMIDSPLVSPGEIYTASLVFWDGHADIACLELDSDDTFIDQVSPLVVIDQGSLWGHRFRAFGFPKLIDQGEWVSGEMTGVNTDGWIQIEGDNRPVHFVEVGFSGGPVWDETLNGIVGMIVAVERGQGIRVAFFIPSTMLVAIWPDLLADSYEAISCRWQVELPTEYEEREIWVDSPLEDLWDTFTRLERWHTRIEKLLVRMMRTASQFIELNQFVRELSNLDFKENYEILCHRLSDLTGFYRQQAARQVNRMISQREKNLDVTCRELRQRLGGDLSPEEEMLLGLDSIRSNMRDLRRKIVQNPEFDRCFLIIGEMGTGKSFFVHKRMDKESSAWIVLVPANYDQPDFATALLESIRRSSGINWPDLESVENFLEQLEKSSSYYQRFAQVVVVCDDLSRYGLLHDNFLDDLTQHIRNQTQLHHFVWLLTTPHAYFANLALYSAIGRSFWRRYGYSADNGLIAAIDKWIVLEDLDLEFEVGLGLIRESTYHIEDDKFAFECEQVENDSYLCELLCNPFLAWIWLDVMQSTSAELDIEPQEWRFVQFVQAFWEEQSNLLLKRDFNLSHHKPLNELELRRFVIWIATYLKTSGDFYPNRTALINYIVASSQTYGQPLDFERAECTLDVIKHGLILRERISKFLLDEPEATIEILFDGFWGLLFANELYKEYSEVPNSIEEFENRFVGIHPRMLRVTLEFYLWLVESKNNLPDLPIRYCNLVLKSAILPHAAVWSTGAKARAQLQQILVNQVRNEPVQKIDGETLYALLDFLTFISKDILEIPERFRIFQSFYKAIQKHSLASYFLYITDQLFDQLQSAEELVDVLPYFSGCEVMDDTLETKDVPSDEGFTSLLGELAASNLMWLVYEEEWISHENFGQSLIHVLSYLDRIESEFPHAKRIPGQKRGWRRYLFREWLIYHYLGKMSGYCGVRMYDQLVDYGWYGYRRNRCLHRQMEQEANIALGKLHRWRTSRMDEPRFIDFVTGLTESKSSLDRQNAFHIIRHTVPAQAGRHMSMVDPKFVPVLQVLYDDKALSKTKKIRPFARFFEQAFENAEKNRDNDWYLEDE